MKQLSNAILRDEHGSPKKAGESKDQDLVNPLIIALFAFSDIWIPWALGEIGDKKAIKFLCGSLLCNYYNTKAKGQNVSKWAFECNILEALVKLNAQNAINIIIKRLEQYIELRREKGIWLDSGVDLIAIVNIIRSLGRFKNKIAIEVLNRCLKIEFSSCNSYEMADFKKEIQEALEKIAPEVYEPDLDEDGLEEKIQQNIQYFFRESSELQQADALNNLIRLKHKLTQQHLEQIFIENVELIGGHRSHYLSKVVSFFDEVLESKEKLYNLFQSLLRTTSVSKVSLTYTYRTKAAAILALGMIGDKKAIGELKELSYSESEIYHNALIRNAIQISLDKLKSNQPMPNELKHAREPFIGIHPLNQALNEDIKPNIISSKKEDNIGIFAWLIRFFFGIETHDTKSVGDKTETSIAYEQLDPNIIMSTLEKDVRELGVPHKIKLNFPTFYMGE